MLFWGYVIDGVESGELDSTLELNKIDNHLKQVKERILENQSADSFIRHYVYVMLDQTWDDAISKYYEKSAESEKQAARTEAAHKLLESIEDDEDVPFGISISGEAGMSTSERLRVGNLLSQYLSQHLVILDRTKHSIQRLLPQARERIDLSGTYLSGIKLPPGNYPSVNFSNAYVTLADFSSATLDKASIESISQALVSPQRTVAEEFEARTADPFKKLIRLSAQQRSILSTLLSPRR